MNIVPDEKKLIIKVVISLTIFQRSMDKSLFLHHIGKYLYSEGVLVDKALDRIGMLSAGAGSFSSGGFLFLFPFS